MKNARALLSVLSTFGVLAFASSASAQTTPDRRFYANGGFNVAFGSFSSSFGLNAGFQIKATPGDHALIVGPRVFMY